MEKEMVSLKAFAEAHVGGVQKTTQFKVDPRVIEIEDGFNARPIDLEHVACMMESARNGQGFPPIVVRVDAGRIILIDGHHRLYACMKLIEEGFEYKSIDCMQFRGSDADRVALMLTSNAGKNLTPLEMGIQYRKLIVFGWTPKEIAGKVGKSKNHVDDMVTLASSDSSVQQMVKNGEVAAHTAVVSVKKHGSGATKVLGDALIDAKAKGKKKVTKKTMRKPDDPTVMNGREAAIRAEERERCALHIEQEWFITIGASVAEDISKSIRALT